MIPECYKIFNKIYYSFFKLNKHRNINHIKLYISANKQLAIGQKYYSSFCLIKLYDGTYNNQPTIKVLKLANLAIINKNYFTITNIKLVFNRFIDYVMNCAENFI